MYLIGNTHIDTGTGCLRRAAAGVRRLCALVVISLLAVPAMADSLAGEFDPLRNGPSDVPEAGLTHLLDFCAGTAQEELDVSKVDPVIDFILEAEDMSKHTPSPREDIEGAFFTYTLERPLSEALRYAYNQQIPEGAINASSVNFSRWKKTSAGSAGPPELWKMLGDLSRPKTIRGVVRETISPDLHTGAYYEYGLKRAFVLYRQGDRRAMISISCQLGESEIGKKGFIVGDDQDWNYLYTQEKGLDKSGLGWVKTRIYDFLSVCVYVEDMNQPGRIKIGNFQWLRAGWAGFNLVESHHILTGMERQAMQFKALLESEKMPPAADLERVYQSLWRMDEAALRQKVALVMAFIRDKAENDDALKGKRAISKLDVEAYVADMKKDQLVSELMREYMKYTLGKETPLSAFFVVALKEREPSPAMPLS